MQRKKRIIDVEALKEGQTHKFEFEYEDEGICREGFVLKFQGRLVAYENVCRHLPLTLDYNNNQFFTKDGRHIICRTHGAIYEPLSGRCVDGPCKGANLKALPLEIADGAVWV